MNCSCAEHRIDPVLLFEGKSFETRQTFAHDKSMMMDATVRLVGSLRGNLDQKLIRDSRAGYKDLKEEFSNSLFGIFKSYRSGSITIDEMEKQWRASIRDAWEKAYKFGNGSVGNPFGLKLWDEDKVWLKGATGEEFGYLSKFIRDIRNDTLKMDAEKRLGMYVNTLDGIYHHGQVEGSPDYARVWWVLREAKHCFPEGTQVDTPNGKRPMESIGIGDLVSTLNGPKKVTKIYCQDFYGNMARIETDKNTVKCTPNHPFLTQRGWVEAQDLTASDEVMCFENGNNQVYRKIRFPNADYCIPTGGKIGILGTVSALLGKLSFCKRIKSRVSVPIFSVKLNNDLSNPNVNKKFRFDQGRWFKINASILKNVSKLLFWSAGFIATKSLSSRKKGSIGGFSNLRMFFKPVSNLCPDFRSFHGIGELHPPFYIWIYNSFFSFLGEMYSKMICLLEYFCYRNSELGGNECGSIFHIMFKKIFNFFLCPIVPSYQFSPSTFYADGTFGAFADIFIANGTLLPYNNPSFFAISFISALDRAIITSGIPDPMLRECSSAGKTSKMCRSNLRMENIFTHLRSLIYQKKRNVVKVFNLEVEDVHHYIANGFVVHNCDDCIRLAAGSPYTKKTLPGVPRDGLSRCLSNCQCILRFDYKGKKEPEPSPKITVPRPPRIPEGLSLPTSKEYDHMAQMSAEIDRLRGLIASTSGDLKKEYIQARKEINQELINYAEKKKVYYVPKSGYIQSAKPKEILPSKQARVTKVEPPEGYRLPSEKEKERIDKMATEVVLIRSQIVLAMGLEKKALIVKRHEVNQDMIDYMEKKKIYYILPVELGIEAGISLTGPEVADLMM